VAELQGLALGDRFWREGGRLRKQYLRRQDVADVREQCQERRRLQKLAAASRQQWREDMALLRILERLCRPR